MRLEVFQATAYSSSEIVTAQSSDVTGNLTRDTL
jgi:hypothetical protein